MVEFQTKLNFKPWLHQWYILKAQVIGRSVSMIFQPKLFFQNFSLNTEVRKCYINFGDLGDLGFIGRMKPEWLLIPSYNSPRAHFLIRKFWQNRGHATVEYLYFIKDFNYDNYQQLELRLNFSMLYSLHRKFLSRTRTVIMIVLLNTVHLLKDILKTV